METEDDCVNLEDDSGFEILPSSEEEVYSASSFMWSSTLDDSLYESMSCSLSSLRMMHVSENNSGILSTNSTASAPHSNRQTDSVHDPDLDVENQNAEAEIIKTGSRASDVGECQHQENETVENLNTRSEKVQLSTNGAMLVPIVEDSENQRTVSPATKRIVSTNFNAVTHRSHSQTTAVGNSEFESRQNQKGVEQRWERCQTKAESVHDPDLDVENRNTEAEIIKTGSRASDVGECQHQENETVENLNTRSDKVQLSSNGAMLVPMVEDSESQRTVSPATKRIVSTNFNAVTPRSHSQTTTVGNSEFESRQNQKGVKQRWENHSCSTDQNDVDEMDKVDFPAFESYDPVLENMDEASERQSTISSSNQSESSVTGPLMRIKRENTVIQLHLDGKKNSKRMCFIMKHGLKICSWLRNNKRMQGFVSGTKSSFNTLLNRFEAEMNSMFGMEDPLGLLIIADTEDSSAIEDAFYESFCGQVVVSKCQIGEDNTTVPVLPIGYNCALEVVQSKINIAREVIRNSEKMIVVSMANFIAEINPQRWQAAIVLYLEDPELQLTLHNFTPTIPVPNAYIDLAKRLTPEQYPLKEHGFAVTLEDVISYSTETQSKDAQKFLSGVNRYINLKSGASILAGMYKKYTSG